MKHYSTIIGAIFASCFFFACTQKEEEHIVIPVESVTISQPTLTLESGKTHYLTASVFPPNATDAEITWTSSNKLVAPVTENGSVTALYEGEAIIYATAGNKRDQCVVTVMASYSHVDVASITISESEYYIKKGVTTYLSALVVFADGATSTKVNWSSSNSDIASIESETGLLTAISKGDVTITAERNGKTATCTVLVVEDEGGGGDVAVTSVTLNQTSITLQHEQSYTLVATVKPDNATNKTVTWSSSEPWLVPVDQNGTVTGYGTWGTITATITAECGGKTATCKVTVLTNTIAVESITLNKTTYTLKVGESYKLVATVKPDNATDKTVSWSSDNSSVATVDEKGKVSALSEGSAKITAKAGEKTATCQVSVQKNRVPATSVTLNKTSLSLSLGETETLIATVEPSNATETVSWISSNKEVLTVDANGRVEALKEGTATVTASANLNVFATCSVTVVPAVDMGLSVLWRQYNLGASSPEEFGDYYAWGDIYTQSNYCWEYYRFNMYKGSWNPNVKRLTKYVYDDGYGKKDYKIVLEPEDDVAHAKLGENWRMPTKEEWDELLDANNCSQEEVVVNGITGLELTSKKTGLSIFLPYAGEMHRYYVENKGTACYWSSSLVYNNRSNGTGHAYGFISRHSLSRTLYEERCYGLSVRPVCKK